MPGSTSELEANIRVCCRATPVYIQSTGSYQSLRPVIKKIILAWLACRHTVLRFRRKIKFPETATAEFNPKEPPLSLPAIPPIMGVNDQEKSFCREKDPAGVEVKRY